MPTNLAKQKGLAFLPTVMMIGIIMAELGIALAFVVYLSNFSVYGARLSQEAWFAARAGINDAVLRLSRDKTFDDNYEISLGQATITMTIEKNTPLANQDRITSMAVVKNRQRKLQAIVGIDSQSDKVSLIVLNEI